MCVLLRECTLILRAWLFQLCKKSFIHKNRFASISDCFVWTHVYTLPRLSTHVLVHTCKYVNLLYAHTCTSNYTLICKNCRNIYTDMRTLLPQFWVYSYTRFYTRIATILSLHVYLHICMSVNTGFCSLDLWDSFVYHKAKWWLNTDWEDYITKCIGKRKV